MGVTEAQAGRFTEAVATLRRALALSPGDATARTNLSGILTDWGQLLDRQGQTDQAIAAFEEAVRFNSDNGAAWALLGDVLYLRHSDMAQAIHAWQQAFASAPSGQRQALSSRISQAQRDHVIERGFIARQTTHFVIRYQQAGAVEGDRLEQALEAAYAQLSRQLGEGPPQLTVIVYTDEALQRSFYQRDWALGFYDGRIRVRLNDIAHAFLEDLVAHEVAHAFLHYRYPGGLPTWIHEGFAQLMERGRISTPETERIEQGIAARTLWVPLKWLDRHFAQPTGLDDVARAYIEARVVVQELVRRYGTDRWSTFCQQLSSGTPVETAFDEVFAPSTWARVEQGNFD